MGIIVACILGLIFLFVLGLFLFLWCRGRKIRQFGTLVPLDLDDDGGYDVLSPSDVEGYRPGDVYNGPVGRRIPGEGSPRQSGDEASSFLRQTRRSKGPSVAQTSAAGAAMSQLPTELGVSRAANRAVPRIQPPTTNSNSSGTQSSNSNASGFGVVIERPNQGLGLLPTEQPQASGLSAADLQRLDQENENEDINPDDSDMYEDGQYTGAYAYAADSLLAPPRPLNPDYSPLNAEFPSHMSDLSEAEVLTAEHRRISSLIGSSTNPDIPGLPAFSGGSSPRHSSFLGAIGLGGLANLGRRSWFKSFDSQRHSPDYTVEPFTEMDFEVGRGMLRPDTIVDSRGRRVVGAGPDGTRPLSGSSARSGASGGTIYHDAQQSSTPGTPLLPSHPRAATPPTPTPVPPVSSSSGNQRATEHLSPLSRPPVNNDEDTVQSPGNTDNLNFDLNTADILDMPAPAALHHFSSLSSLKDTTTGGSFTLKSLFPSGLDTIKPVGWSDVVNEVTDSSPPVSSFGGGAFLNNSFSSSGRNTIDLLDDAPPGAEIGWRSISSGGFGDVGRQGRVNLFFFSPSTQEYALILFVLVSSSSTKVVSCLNKDLYTL